MNRRNFFASPLAVIVPVIAQPVMPRGAVLVSPTFHVDMRGASAEAVGRLERLVMEVNGSIEMRAIRAA